MTIFDNRCLRSSRSLARQKIAITSDATVMSKPSSRGKPLATPPSEETIERNDRSFMSIARRQEMVGRPDGMQIAGEMQIDVLHRHDLSVAAARGPALDAEAGPKRGLAQAQHRLFAEMVERVGEADRGRGLTLARRRRGDRGNQDQLAVGTVLE